MSQTALVTGATGAIGSAIARILAEIPNMHVHIAARDQMKGEQMVRDIRKKTGSNRVTLALVDVARKKSITRLARELGTPLDILVNNAAATPRSRLETPEGLEIQWATNVLGYVWMIQAFESQLLAAGAARVINVASYWAGGLRLDDPEFHDRPYDNNAAYRQSKQADRMLTAAFANKLFDSGITVNACHPGDVNSKLSNNLGFGGHQSPDQGARTPVFLATDSGIAGESGGYYADCRRVSCAFGADAKAVEALYKLCLSY